MGRQGREKEFKIQNSGFKIQDSKFRIQDDELGAQLAKDTYERTPKRTRIAGLRGAKLRPAAVPFRNRKCMIQNSRFKMKWGCQSRLDIHLDSGRSLRRARSSGPAGRELRASAAGRLRPANRYAIDFVSKKPAGKFGPSGPAARSRPRAEGCSFCVASPSARLRACLGWESALQRPSRPQAAPRFRNFESRP